MRIALAVFAAISVWATTPVMAYENFIPLGHPYSPDNHELEPINSDEARLNAQVDVFEAEIWTRQRTAKTFSSQLDRFSNDQELKGGSEFIDY